MPFTQCLCHCQFGPVGQIPPFIGWDTEALAFEDVTEVSATDTVRQRGVRRSRYEPVGASDLCPRHEHGPVFVPVHSAGDR